MEIEELITKNKWNIIRELSRGEKSASELAKKTGQTIANVSTTLKLLEGHGIVKKAKPAANMPDGQARKKPGKPKQPFELAQEAALSVIIKPGLAEKQAAKLKDLNPFQELLLAGGLVMGQDLYFLVKYCCESDLVGKAESIGLVKSEAKEIELFIIAENLDEIRKSYSNYTVSAQGIELDVKTKKIISWSHNRKEVEEGLEKGDEYFINLARNSKILLDKKGYLFGLKQRLRQ